jgi:uncharacterized peroxidase-related enzyme
MAWIETVSDEQAEGKLAAIYEAARQRAGKVFNVVRVQSLNPATLRTGLAHYRETMFGDSPLTRAQRELIAVVVSRTNGCFY